MTSTASNFSTAPAGGVSVGGTTFINLGIQGVGRYSASATDPDTGETLGSFSGMQITGWSKDSNGTYSGVFQTLPDRGYNSGSTYSNYAARINSFNFTFTPYASNATTTNQNQITMSFAGSTRFTYDHDNNVATAPIYTTGLLPTTSNGSLFGKTVPVVSTSTTQSDGTFASRLCLDAEAIAFDNRSGKAGSGWVGDEYGANIYHFNSSKQIDGILGTPAALQPTNSGNFSFASDPLNGRRTNQGFEGVGVSPDGTKLFALLQSATIQDSGSGSVGRSNTRLLVYDLSSSDTPTASVTEHVIQLPLVDDNGGSFALNKTAAQSEIVVLNNTQFLILARDGNGRGANTTAPVFKSVLLADISTASNILSQFDAEGNQVAPSGVLNASVTPITWSEALNMMGKVDLSITELEQFGFNYNANNGDMNTISEKWEAMSLVSANDPNAPNDYFLFLANDNDFTTASVKMFDASGTLQTYSGTLENDNVVLAYRVQVVPEPSTLVLLVLAGVGLLVVRSRMARRA